MLRLILTAIVPLLLTQIVLAWIWFRLQPAGTLQIHWGVVAGIVLASEFLAAGLAFAAAQAVSRRIVNAFQGLQKPLARGDGQAPDPACGIGEFDELRRHLQSLVWRAEECTAAWQRAVVDDKRSSQDLQRFAYVAAHDLQEPLRVITGYLQLLERRYHAQLDDDGRQFIGYVVEAVDRLQQLLAGLLQYARVDSRGIPLAAIDPLAALRAALDGLQRSIAESSAQITHGELPAVRSDAAQLTQLFSNLIGNSIKYRGGRAPQIHVGAERDGEGWIFSVRDNGIGIERQYFDQMFVLFQRLHTRRQYPGTGIGLAVCRKIVERHGGRIWIESQPGEGTTVFFTLPGAETPCGKPVGT